MSRMAQGGMGCPRLIVRYEVIHATKGKEVNLDLPLLAYIRLYMPHRPNRSIIIDSRGSPESVQDDACGLVYTRHNYRKGQRKSSCLLRYS